MFSIVLKKVKMTSLFYIVHNGFYRIVKQCFKVIILHSHRCMCSKFYAVAKSKWESTVSKHSPRIIDGNRHHKCIGSVFTKNFQTIVGEMTGTAIERAGSFGLNNHRTIVLLNIFAHLFECGQCLGWIFTVNKHRTAVAQVV